VSYADAVDALIEALDPLTRQAVAAVAARGFTTNPTVKQPQLRKLSAGEETLALHLRAAGIPFVRQFRFDLNRRWRYDFAIQPFDRKLAVEVQGLTKGRALGAHQRVDGLTREYEKLNAAVLAGWRVLLFTPAQVKSGYALETIKAALA